MIGRGRSESSLLTTASSSCKASGWCSRTLTASKVAAECADRDAVIDEIQRQPPDVVLPPPTPDLTYAAALLRSRIHSPHPSADRPLRQVGGDLGATLDIPLRTGMSRCDGCERDTQTIAGRCANCGAVKVPAVAPRATLPKPEAQATTADRGHRDRRARDPRDPRRARIACSTDLSEARVRGPGEAPRSRRVRRSTAAVPDARAGGRLEAQLRFNERDSRARARLQFPWPFADCRAEQLRRRRAKRRPSFGEQADPGPVPRPRKSGRQVSGGRPRARRAPAA